MTHPINFFTLFMVILAVHIQPGSSQDRPNILICITDDQSWVHTSFAGEKAIATPAFDRVAGEGLYFKNVKEIASSFILLSSQ